jgi:hypothetical protein
MKTFSEWLEKRNIKESREGLGRKRGRTMYLRPDLEDESLKKLEVSVGDIVELGPETEHKGQKVLKIARVTEIRSRDVVVADLSRLGRKISIPISQLYDKEELLGRTLFPADERQLALLKSKRLWVRLTPRQYEKFAASYRVKNPEEIIPITSDERPSTALRKMFSKRSTTQNDDPEVDALKQMFSSTEQTPEEVPMFKKGSPLSRYISRKKEEEEERMSDQES